MMTERCRDCFANSRVCGSLRPESWCLALIDTDFGSRPCPFYKRAGTTATMEQREYACKKYSETHSQSRK